MPYLRSSFAAIALGRGVMCEGKWQFDPLLGGAGTDGPGVGCGLKATTHPGAARPLLLGATPQRNRG